MKKGILLAAFLLMIALVGMAACNKGTQESTTEEPSYSSQEESSDSSEESSSEEISQDSSLDEEGSFPNAGKEWNDDNVDVNGWT